MSLMSLFSTSTHLAQASSRSNSLDTANQLDNGGNTLATASKFLDDLKHLSDRINLRLKPDGSQMYPARSCRDIADYYPNKPNGRQRFHFILTFTSIDCSSGLYFIDPNEGSKSDAVLVYCKLTERLTCVNASHPLIQSSHFLNKLIPSQQRFQLMGDLLQPAEVMKERTTLIKSMNIVSLPF